jgi:GNAT superfamily N-acetyltransferase
MNEATIGGGSRNLSFREALLPSDIHAVRRIVRATGFFSEEEAEVALELAMDALALGGSSAYRFTFAEEQDGAVAGYACFGAVPCTRGSFDIYWMAVHPDSQGSGIGAALIKRVEDLVLAMGGERIYIETASRALYRPTRLFYEKMGYTAEASLEDFYSRGDGKIIYVKRLR